MDGNIAGVLFCPADQDPQHYFPKIVQFHRCHMKRVKDISLSFDEDYEASPDVLLHDEKCSLKD